MRLVAERDIPAALNEAFFGEEDALLDPADERTITRLQHLAGERNSEDILTKLLDGPRHWMLMDMLQFIPVPPEAERRT